MLKTNIFKGIITALITPFKNDKIDFQSLENIIKFQINAKVSALVIGGSTGEGSSLDDHEYDELINYVVKFNNNRIPIIAGMTAISTSSAIKKAQKLNKFGIDGLMCTPPHYVRPMQEGIYQHFYQIHQATDIPIMLYSHQGRTGTDFSNETLERLAKLERIIALKDAGLDLHRPLLLRKLLPSHFNLLSGNDDNIIEFNKNGGNGSVSVAANVIPNLLIELQHKCESPDSIKALQLNQTLLPLYQALSLESNPIGIKYASHILGLCEEEMRLPLTTPSEETKIMIKKSLENLTKL